MVISVLRYTTENLPLQKWEWDNERLTPAGTLQSKRNGETTSTTQSRNTSSHNKHSTVCRGRHTHTHPHARTQTKSQRRALGQAKSWMGAHHTALHSHSAAIHTLKRCCARICLKREQCTAPAMHNLRQNPKSHLCQETDTHFATC